MLITKEISTVVEEHLEIKTPAFFKDRNIAIFHQLRNDGGILTVIGDNLMMITMPGSQEYKAKLSKLLEQLPATESEFLTHYLNAADTISYEPTFEPTESGHE